MQGFQPNGEIDSPKFQILGGKKCLQKILDFVFFIVKFLHFLFRENLAFLVKQNNAKNFTMFHEIFSFFKNIFVFEISREDLNLTLKYA